MKKILFLFILIVFSSSLQASFFIKAPEITLSTEKETISILSNLLEDKCIIKKARNIKEASIIISLLDSSLFLAPKNIDIIILIRAINKQNSSYIEQTFNASIQTDSDDDFNKVVSNIIKKAILNSLDSFCDKISKLEK